MIVTILKYCVWCCSVPLKSRKITDSHFHERRSTRQKSSSRLVLVCADLGHWQGSALWCSRCCLGCGGTSQAFAAWEPTTGGGGSTAGYLLVTEVLVYQIFWGSGVLLLLTAREGTFVPGCLLPPWTIPAVRTCLQAWPVSRASLLYPLHSE